MIVITKMEYRDFNNLINNDNIARNQLFDYHYNNNCLLDTLPEHDARNAFESMMQNRNEREILVRTFIPHYNPQQNSQNRRSLDERISNFNVGENSTGNDFLISLIGGAALIGSMYIDDETTQTFIQIGGAAGLLIGAKGTYQWIKENYFS